MFSGYFPILPLFVSSQLLKHSQGEHQIVLHDSNQVLKTRVQTEASVPHEGLIALIHVYDNNSVKECIKISSYGDAGHQECTMTF